MISNFFPLDEMVEINSDLRLDPDIIVKIVGPLLTPDRLKKIDQVLENRTFDSVVVLEDIYDRGNASAVMRSMEAMGFAACHMIETGQKFKAANRVAKGADKWVETKKWKSPVDCIQHLKQKGYKIVATSLEASKPIFDVDFTIPTALVLGNEKDGISQTMKELADERIVIPMEGFVQSFNISVAGALCMYHIFSERVRKYGKQGNLSEREKQILRAHYYLRTQDSAYEMIQEMMSRGQIQLA